MSVTEEYSVSVEARAPKGEPPLTHATDIATDPIVHELSERLVECLAERHGSGGVGSRSWSITFTVYEQTIGLAVMTGMQIAQECARDAELPNWPIVHLEVDVSETVLVT